ERRLKRATIELDTFKNTDKHMGRTYQTLIADLMYGFRPNDLGRLVGVVEGGGLVILITPPLDKWPEYRNIFSETLTVPKYPKPRNIFIRWFVSTLLSSEGVFIYDLDKNETVKFSPPEIGDIEKEEIKIPDKRIFSEEIYKLSLTQDQINVINAIETLIPKPKKNKIIVITADRGRGKSGAVGIAVPALIKELLKVKNKVRVGVTAISPTNVETLMSLAQKALDKIGMKYRTIERDGKIIELRGDNFSIEYWPPAIIPRLDLDVVVVDEAAGLPVSILHKIWRSFNRVIMATTIHGYEGAGRGFSIRFLKKVRSDPDTELIYLEMKRPIRYSNNDPVEKWIFKALLLDAEPEPLTEEDYELIKRQEFIYLRFDPEELFREENIVKLKSIFGIYVEAHYRNEPDDLGMIADAPHHRVRALALSNGKIIASAQLAEEGELTEDLIRRILEEGSVHGNIIPDRVIKYYRDKVFGKYIGYRIVRIAVHPEAQGMGIGSYFLRKIEEEARESKLDWVGSGFGATEELLNFWMKNGYLPIHISPSRNPVSGEYSVIVLKGLREDIHSSILFFNKKFRERLVNSLYDTYRDLETEVVYKLLQDPLCSEYIGETQVSFVLDSIDRDRLNLYLKKYMTYEVVNDIIINITKTFLLNYSCLIKLEKKHCLLLIAKVLQGRTWENVSQELKIPLSKATDLLRQIIGEISSIMLKETYRNK
ncbi:MAG: tRNA(Met) cytidine acetyltransferase TmcA, partial [Sulfolobales archaeon]